MTRRESQRLNFEVDSEITIFNEDTGKSLKAYIISVSSDHVRVAINNQPLRMSLDKEGFLRGKIAGMDLTTKPIA